MALPRLSCSRRGGAAGGSVRYGFYSVVFTVGIALLYFAHRYAWRRLVKDTGVTGAVRRLTAAILIAGCASIPLGMIIGRYVDRTVSQPFAIVAFSWAGFMAFLITILFALDAGVLGARLVARLRGRNVEVPSSEPNPAAPTIVTGPTPSAPPSTVVHPAQTPPAPSGLILPARRAFLARASAGAALGTAGGLFVIGARNAFGEVAVKEVPVGLARLPKALDGFKIVQLTDVHIGAMLDGRFLDGVVETVNRQKPDLVVITGDLVDGSTRLIGADVARLGGIQSRHGTWFITGNHEYYSGAGDWIPFLDKLRIPTLVNSRVVIGDKGPGGASFDLAGIPDRQGTLFVPEHEPNLGRALEGRDPERELVLLAHRPNPITEAAAHGVGLQLSGHTHGGQFFPITAIGELVHPYNAGLHRHGDLTQIYVSCGTGFWGPPIRILAPSEVTSIRLYAT